VIKVALDPKYKMSQAVNFWPTVVKLQKKMIVAPAMLCRIDRVILRNVRALTPRESAEVSRDRGGQYHR
jgi:hypothetical protein